MARKSAFVRKIDQKIKNKGGGLPFIQEDNVLPPAVRVLPAPDTLIEVAQGIQRSTQAPLAYVSISWQEAPNISPDYYNVEWSESSSFTDVQRKRANTLSATIENLKVDTTYYFRVQAVQGGSFSDYSETLSVLTLPDLTVPPDVTSLDATFVKSNLVITWVKPASETYKDAKILIYNAAHTILYGTFYSGSQQFVWSAEQNLQASGNVGVTSVSVDVISRSWNNVLSTGVNDTATAAVPATPSGIASNWISDNGTADEHVVVSWLAVDNADSYELSLDGITYKTKDLRFNYLYDRNQQDHTPTLASGDPTLSYLLTARDRLNQVSVAASGTLTNAAPSGSLLAVSAVAGFSSIAAHVTVSQIIQDFDHFEWILTKDAVTDQEFNSSTPDVTFLASGSGTYRVSVKAVDKFNQQSSAVLSSNMTMDVLTISQLRAETTYTDFINTSAVFLNRLKDGLTIENGGGAYVFYDPIPSGSWGWISAARPLLDRYKTITWSAYWPDNFNLVFGFTDGTNNSFYGAPVTVSGGINTLTKYTSLATAQSNPIHYAEFDEGTLRFDLPAIIEARTCVAYFQNVDGDLGVFEFYPRRLVQSDDIEAESIRSINIAAQGINADRIFAITLSALSANMGNLHMDGVIDIATTGGIYQGTGSFGSPTTGLKIFNAGGIGVVQTLASGVIQVQLDTDGKFKAGAGKIILDASGISLAANSSFSSSDEKNIRWLDSSSNLIGAINTNFFASTMNNIVINATNNGTRNSGIDLIADGTSDNDAWLYIRGNRDGAASVIRMFSENNEVYITKSSGWFEIYNTSVAVVFSVDNSGNVGANGALNVNSINVGGATGATAGQLKLSDKIYPNGSSSAYSGNTLTIANNAVAAIGTNNFAFVFIHAQSAGALYILNGGTHTTSEIHDAAGIYTPTAGTASSINIYWSAANSRYEIENKRGASISARIWILEAA